jgi:hypothetical protein
MREALALALLVASPLAAQERPPSPQPRLAEDENIEAQLTADLNADGYPDLAYIAAKEDGRELRVVTSYRDQLAIGQNMPEVLALDPYPLADGVLTVKGNVLRFEDLTGGTTAVFSIHRFRWDRTLGAMRLIGLDAALYSRTYAHDGQEASWNLLTGDLVTRTLKLNRGTGDRGYDKVGETRTRKLSPPVRLDKSPSGDDLLEWPGAN